MNGYATLAAIRRHLGLDAAQTADDDRLQMLLEIASRLIDAYAGRRFYPVRQTIRYTCESPGLLLLRDDLLALHSLTNGDSRALSPDVYHLHPARSAVKSSVRLDRTQAAFTHDGDPVDALAVEGTWGCHPGWADAWVPSGDSVQDDPLAADAVTITVIDADAPDITGGGQRFTAGQLLGVEDEYLHVLTVDTATNLLTVARGANGTTPAAHAQAAPIAVYQPPADIRQVCLRVATWLYQQQDAGFAMAAGSLRSQIIVPAALPDDVRQILAPYIRVQVS